MEVLEVECIKGEPDWENPVSEHAHALALQEDLYADHKVKHELVLGPELLQRVHQPVPRIIEVTVKIENGETCKEEPQNYSEIPDTGIVRPIPIINYMKSTGDDRNIHSLSQKDLFKLQNCFVKIERMILHKEQYTCKTCGATYSRRSSLTYHIMRTHAKKEVSRKRKMSNSTKNTKKETSTCINKNQLKKNVEKPHTCNICGKHFKLRAQLINHERIHTQEKPYSCTICDKSFTELSNLKRHQRTHTGERPFSCEVCKKQFSFKCNLMDHIRIHTKEKPYSCNLCSKQFRDHKGLKRHKLSHTGYKKFICDICKNQFARKYYLAEHLRTHTKRKPYSCKICSKQFKVLCDLTAHKKLHRKQCLCEICDEEFSDVHALEKHLLSHLG